MDLQITTDVTPAFTLGDPWGPLGITGFTTTDETALTTDEGSGADDYSGYDALLTEGMPCDKSWVRAFRGRYEPPLFWSIFVLGAVGNLTVVWIYTTLRNRLKTMTDVYLLNLAVADLLFLGTLPFWAGEATLGWQFGTGLCKVVSAVYRVNFFSSMLLLTCISVDRYVAIVQVTKAHNLKKQRLFYSKLACLAVWLLSVLLALPEFIFSQAGGQDQRASCTLLYPSGIHTKVAVLALQVCVGFCLPLLVMVVCYSVIIRTLLQARSFQKHKALRVIFSVVAVFVLSQLPYNGLLAMEASQASNTTITDCAVVERLDVAGQVAKSLAYTHACVNPFLYVFVGVRFRKDLVKVARACAGGLGGGLKDGFSQTSHAAAATPKRPSVMSDTETTPALSL